MDESQQRMMLIVAIVILFFILISEFMVQYNNKIHQNDTIQGQQQSQSLYQTTDKPKIQITRMGSAIEVRYLGGTDKGFIGDFRITIDNKTTYYKNPGEHNVVAMIEHWKITCIDVEAMDKAVQVYRPIGSACL